jgi:hypothetical protein
MEEVHQTSSYISDCILIIWKKFHSVDYIFKNSPANVPLDEKIKLQSYLIAVELILEQSSLEIELLTHMISLSISYWGNNEYLSISPDSKEQIELDVNSIVQFIINTLRERFGFYILYEKSALNTYVLEKGTEKMWISPSFEMMKHFQFLTLLSNIDKSTQIGPICVYDEKKTYSLMDVERFALSLVQDTINLHACKLTDQSCTDLKVLPLIRNPFSALVHGLKEPLRILNPSSISIKKKKLHILHHPSLKTVKTLVMKTKDIYKEFLPLAFFNRENVLHAISRVEYILELAANNPEKLSKSACEEKIANSLSTLHISTPIEEKEDVKSTENVNTQPKKKERKKRAKRSEINTKESASSSAPEELPLSSAPIPAPAPAKPASPVKRSVGRKSAPKSKKLPVKRVPMKRKALRRRK